MHFKARSPVWPGCGQCCARSCVKADTAVRLDGCTCVVLQRERSDSRFCYRRASLWFPLHRGVFRTRCAFLIQHLVLQETAVNWLDGGCARHYVAEESRGYAMVCTKGSDVSLAHSAVHDCRRFEANRLNKKQRSRGSTTSINCCWNTCRTR